LSVVQVIVAVVLVILLTATALMMGAAPEVEKV
jgi:hypothetical protein